MALPPWAVVVMESGSPHGCLLIHHLGQVLDHPEQVIHRLGQVLDYPGQGQVEYPE